MHTMVPNLHKPFDDVPASSFVFCDENEKMGILFTALYRLSKL